jgi:hypothetical protein
MSYSDRLSALHFWVAPVEARYIASQQQRQQTGPDFSRLEQLAGITSQAIKVSAAIIYVDR